MNKIEKLELRYQATRYGVDMIDLAWSYELEHEHNNSSPELVETKRAEMSAHRFELLEMQNEILSDLRKAKGY